MTPRSAVYISDQKAKRVAKKLIHRLEDRIKELESRIDYLEMSVRNINGRED